MSPEVISISTHFEVFTKKKKKKKEGEAGVFLSALIDGHSQRSLLQKYDI